MSQVISKKELSGRCEPTNENWNRPWLARMVMLVQVSHSSESEASSLKMGPSIAGVRVIPVDD
jgi:hypothetical protein